MNELDRLLENLLLEAAALTKGSQRVMNNKDLVAGIADAMRDDARMHPQNFPTGAGRAWQKTPDEELAHWFLEQLDNIEKEGYEGTVYSRDGVNSDWIARRYIAGSHNWEDIIGTLNMNLRDWYMLRNRDMLDANHKDLPKFNSIRDVGKYLTTHYHDKIEAARDAAKNAALNKMAKKAKLVDNEDYSIFTVFNWAGARAVGLGTNWCTANSVNDANYNNYSNNGMLFQMFPKNPEYVNKTGSVLKSHIKGPEKYQFDGGSGSFMDIADDRVNADTIREKFPYLWNDLKKSMLANKEKLETAMREMHEDPQLMKNPATRTKVYDIDDELRKLKKHLGSYFTDKVRKEVEPEQLPSAPGENQVQEDDAPGVGDDMATGGSIGAMGGDTAPAPAGTYAPGTAPTMPESVQNKGNIMENVDKDVAAMMASLKKYDMLAESVAPVLAPRKIDEKKGGKPEWLEDAEKKAEKKEGKKEEVDEGKTNRKECPTCHCSPCECDDDAVMEKDEGKHNNGKTTGFAAVAKNAAKEYGSKEAGEKVAGAVHAKMKAAGKLEEGEQGPDAEVLNWMKRFNKLGNMKGYGR